MSSESHCCAISHGTHRIAYLERGADAVVINHVVLTRPNAKHGQSLNPGLYWRLHWQRALLTWWNSPPAGRCRARALQVVLQREESLQVDELPARLWRLDQKVEDATFTRQMEVRPASMRATLLGVDSRRSWSLRCLSPWASPRRLSSSCRCTGTRAAAR